MNVALATDSYELPARLPLTWTETRETPADTFVCKLVASLRWTFALDAEEQALARQLLFGRKLGALAGCLGVDTRRATRLCQALFTKVGADGRQMLFEIALRLTTVRELGSHFSAQA